MGSPWRRFEFLLQSKTRLVWIVGALFSIRAILFFSLVCCYMLRAFCIFDECCLFVYRIPYCLFGDWAWMCACASSSRNKKIYQYFPKSIENAHCVIFCYLVIGYALTFNISFDSSTRPCQYFFFVPALFCALLPRCPMHNIYVDIQRLTVYSIHFFFFHCFSVCCKLFEIFFFFVCCFSSCHFTISCVHHRVCIYQFWMKNTYLFYPRLVSIFGVHCYTFVHFWRANEYFCCH